MMQRTKRVNLSGWLRHYFKLREMEKRFTFLVICPQGIPYVSRLGVVNFTR